MRVAQGSAGRTQVFATGSTQVFFDADCGFCTRTARLLRRLDKAGRLELIPLQHAGAVAPDAPDEHRLLARMHVRDAGGRWGVGGAAWLRIAEVVPALQPLAWVARLSFVRPLVEPVYDLVARNRHRISRALGDEACPTRDMAR